jgi:hypothetical protein
MWSQSCGKTDRANLVVFDFTSEKTTEASRADAQRRSRRVLRRKRRMTGAVIVLDSRTKQEMAAIHGSRDFAEYRSAIDAALSGARQTQ